MIERWFSLKSLRMMFLSLEPEARRLDFQARELTLSSCPATSYTFEHFNVSQISVVP